MSHTTRITQMLVTTRIIYAKGLIIERSAHISLQKRQFHYQKKKKKIQEHLKKKKEKKQQQ